jgi:Fur family ferric uptake transcriptional regulator
MLKDYFKNKGLKLTKQRELIYNTIKNLEEAKLKDIINNCNNNMDNSTIYRIIDLFIEKGIIIKTLDSENNICYIINDQHKHYINCIKCHQKTPINICPIDNIKDIGYQLVSHQIILNGICSKCQKNKS